MPSPTLGLATAMLRSSLEHLEQALAFASSGHEEFTAQSRESAGSTGERIRVPRDAQNST